MNTYISPFSTRYASQEMSHLFSAQYKILTFRKLWVALAKAEKTLGLPISKEQILEMEKHLESIDFSAAAAYEKRFRHDVMAHIHAFGDLCPKARPIIHLGATSCYVTDNTDLIQCKEGLRLLSHKLIHVMNLLASFVKTTLNMPCLSYTHFQSAQPTTFGKRACLWLQDFFFDAMEWEKIYESLPFLGVKGATGTQSSFLALFDGDHDKVAKLEKWIAKEFGFAKILPISGQTYTRKIDLCILNAFESFAASAHKMATDIRLLAHDGEMLESFEKSQIGSSAMPYKRNPIYSERICGLARFVISLAQNPAYTVATQWLERSLDDSSNRRLAIPEAFLGVDALLNLLTHLISHLEPVPHVAKKRIESQMSSLVMENILMHAVKKGGDRQNLHETLRQISKENSLKSLLKEIETRPEFHLSRKEIKPLLTIPSLVGRAPQQARDFLKNEILPFLHRRKQPTPKIPSIEN